jgi:NAD(P)-dependent dehydrogenase (short-subunit alcohol dehydrogenase family)
MSGIEAAGARVVVTGAGSGIGAATARRFAGAGADVIAVDIDEAAAVATAEDCAGAAYQCDVSDPAAVDALAEAVEAGHGPVDVLVNNAGVGVAGPFLDAAPEDWDWIRGVNLDGVVYGCRAFGARMVQRGRGHVVNVASGSGYVPNRNMAAYCATKAAVLMLSQCLRADWAGDGVGVSVICPGVIDTPIAAHTRMVGTMAGKQEKALRAFGRFGHSPDLVAKAIVRAAERNQDVVPVGLESTLAYRVLRLAPGPVQGLVARAQVL